MKHRKRRSAGSSSRRSPGLSEEGASYRAPAPAGPEPGKVAFVELGVGGRLVIPAPMRAALGMKVGDKLRVRLEGNELRVHTYDEGIRQAQAILAKYLPKGVDAVDDFLRWRREQAKIEQEKYDKWSRRE